MTDKDRSHIRDEAIAWVARQDGATLSPTDARQFQLWLAVPGHREAYRRAVAFRAEMARALARPPVSSNAELFAAPSRRPSFWAGGALIAACLVIVVAPTLWFRLIADAYTGVGQIRTVELFDGSSVTLDTQSAIAVRMTSTQRTVRLLKGAAAFHVAADAARPFRVQAAGGEIRALGTVFIVRKDGDRVRVTGIEHAVDVAFSDKALLHHQQLEPGQAVDYGPDCGMTGAEPAEAGADSFERGQLVFDGKSLAEVIAELNRYHAGRIQLLGSDLARLRVSFVFPAGDPLAALDALRDRFDLKEIRISDAFILVYR